MPAGSVRIPATRSLTFWPSNMPPPPGLAPWPMHDLDGVGAVHVVRVEPVAARQALVHEVLRRRALLGRHAAVARGRRRPDRRRRPTERLLGVAGQRAEAHPGDRDRGIQHERLRRVPRAEHRRRRARLPVALHRIPRRRRGDEHEVVERGQRCAWHPTRGSRSAPPPPSRGSGR